eukprot:3270265-Pyramimonas_sp.AAC.1
MLSNNFHLRCRDFFAHCVRAWRPECVPTAPMRSHLDMVSTELRKGRDFFPKQVMLPKNILTAGLPGGPDDDEGAPPAAAELD